MTWQTKTTSVAGSQKLAEQIGQRLQGGELLEMISDLGGGKTTFVRGLAKGIGSKDQVSSPSFTLHREYQAGSLIMHHFDLYRLPEPGIMGAELDEVLADPRAIVVIEWPDIIQKSLPAPRMEIHIRPIAEKEREFSFVYPKAMAYLIPRDKLR
ncbi:MAG TPA: tRNA (adenosine(37)-N6)-threonylcarbamoyltransferase complex ATPase subunit type 1 TsaE [Candidatus Dormibacteraeota bacterium]|nr:tRNA (adenosine(37)-N6)-threonylcarbamoyltransferase complex ATPase subunit type 1 TsaE [Candidatus Dormibacteraeota bacterium]